MTSHKLAQLLKQLSDILFAMPNSKIDKSFSKILEIVSKELSLGADAEKEKDDEDKEVLMEESDIDWGRIITSLKENDLEDSKKFLESDTVVFKVATLRELAKRLNISISGRPKKDNLIHTILKSLERDRLDKTIRSRSKLTESDNT
jgi:hypothetical protein